MLNFCPYEFIPINTDNLAYELVFWGGWSWKKVQEKTIVGGDTIKYINTNDVRRYDKYKKDNTGQHVMLLENMHPGGKSGFKLFLELIEKRNNDLVEANQSIIYDGETAQRKDDVNDKDFSTENGGKKELHFKVIDGHNMFFVDQEPVMHAVPCCPNCHNRLPVGWENAEDFGAISLMAPSGCGKTTFLLSMMNNNWRAFRNLQMSDGKKIDIVQAHWDDEQDKIYQNMNKRSEEMCKENGTCPDSTVKEHSIPPMFINVQYDHHVMIIGFYDNAGENLRDMNLLKIPSMRFLLKEMFAEMFFFDPCDMNIALPQKTSVSSTISDEDFQLKTIEEQGKMQKEKCGKKISAEELLEKTSENNSQKNVLSAFWDMYYSHRRIFQQYNCQENLKKMYFLGIIIKSDLLEELEEIRSNEEYAILFDRNAPNYVLNKNAMDMRSELVEKMIQDLNLFGDTDLNQFKQDFGEVEPKGEEAGRQAVSWHCISALGCDADSPKKGGKLHGEYAPIRLTDPLATCIYQRIIDNGWVK